MAAQVVQEAAGGGDSAGAVRVTASAAARAAVPVAQGIPRGGVDQRVAEDSSTTRVPGGMCGGIRPGLRYRRAPW